MASRIPSRNIESAIMVQRSRSSQINIVIVKRGKRSMMVLHERVRKCEGFERTDGRCER